VALYGIGAEQLLSFCCRGGISKDVDLAGVYCPDLCLLSTSSHNISDISITSVSSSLQWNVKIVL